MFVLAYAVAGIFGRGRPRPSKDKSGADKGATAGRDQAAAGPAAAGRNGGRARGRVPKRARKPAAANPVDGSNGGGLFGGKDPDDDEDLPTGFKFDWVAYRAAFGETPMEDAVTIMFAEYAELYARIAGWTTSSTPEPMSLEEGEDIQKQAAHFVLNVMSPILGYVHTSKVHKLLAHTLDSIRYHGHLRHGNTSSNEAAHKLDKRFYRRTNMAIDTFTGQLVRQSQGAREIGLRNDHADAHDRATLRLVPPLVGPRRAGSAGGNAPPVSGSEGAPAAVGGRARPTTSGVEAPDAGGGVALAAGGWGAAAPGSSVGKPRRRSADYLTRQTTGVLAQRPGLSDLSALFKLPPTSRVPVLSTVEFTPMFNCGTKSKQLLRASPHVRGERPWYDAILCSVEKPAGGVDGGRTGRSSKDGSGSGSDGDSADAGGIPDEVHVAEVRAIIRCKEDDVAVVCDMDVVDSVPGCPFRQRACIRLKWALSSSGGSMIRAVPLSQVRRLVHVVPDFQDLASRKGLAAAPAGLRSPAADRRAMRYFINEFYPWA